MEKGRPTTEAEISSARLRERMAKMGDIAEPAGYVSLQGDERIQTVDETTGDLGGAEDNG